MKTIQQILNDKGPDIWSVTPETPLGDALQLMSDRNIGAILVLDGQELVGIFSERDFARKMKGVSELDKNLPVSEVMTRRVVYVKPEQTVSDGMNLMAEKKIRHLPVLDKEKTVVGLVSVMDIVRTIISDQQFTIDQLEQYVYHD